MEDDAALMAELLAISNRSASSRFDHEDENENAPEPSPPRSVSQNQQGNAAESSRLNGNDTNSYSSPVRTKGRLAS
jgi:hypothetical protein